VDSVFTLVHSFLRYFPELKQSVGKVIRENASNCELMNLFSENFNSLILLVMGI
jgi:hypothetical protein